MSAQALLNQAIADLRCFRGDPMARALDAQAGDPDWGMPAVFMAWLHLLSTEPGSAQQARVLLDKAQPLRLSPEEAAHWQAADALAQGHWFEASDRVLTINRAHPLDGLALQVGHQIDFFTGNTARLHSRIAEALPAWQRVGSAEREGYHAVLGMLAFGLEESAQYEEAERVGRQAVELEPHDGWAWHAVAHVMEMQSRRAEGAAWYASSSAWSEGSFFSIHNHWHWSLFELGLGRVDEVLDRFDRDIFANAHIALNLLDATSLLWRLMLLGVDVGERWQPLAQRWATHAQTSTYAFNDMHAMMAFACAGRDGLAADLLKAQTDALGDGLAEATDNSSFLKAVGAPATRAMQAFAQSRYAEAADLLRPVIPKSVRFGGSHAQRQVLQLTLSAALAKL